MSTRRIVIVGTGPRGMMVLERLAARLVADPEPLEIHLIDAVEVGGGRVYRSSQPELFLMNTVAGQISAFSGLPDGGPARPGAGPSFVEWWDGPGRHDAGVPCVGVDGYAPRAVYGRYLRYVLDTVAAALPAPVRLRRTRERVTDLVADGDRYRLTLAGGSTVVADRVVLTTGHSLPEPQGQAARFTAFARSRPGVRYLAGDSAADMDLAAIRPGSAVGVIGLGLSFYDVLAALTEGRGGRFEPAGGDDLVYRPSGREPVVVAGSRSGMVLPARGRNQKPPTWSYRPALFRPEHVRATAGPGRTDFRRDVWPWLAAEVELVHQSTVLRHRHGAARAELFAETVVRESGADGRRPLRVPDVAALACGFGDAPAPPPLDLDALARPFGDRTFASPEGFDAALAGYVRRDLGDAALGNRDSPVKAALDVLRDTRWVLRELTDFGGLDPRSHRDDFLGWYVPRSAFLAAGPPGVRLRQVLALVACGLLRVAGPDTRFTTSDGGRFVVSSPRVAGSAREVDTLIDARIPVPDVRTDRDPLVASLRGRGTWTSFVNATEGSAFDTGGVAVGPSPFHPLGRDGSPDPGLYVLGIPAEHTRWFTQVGSSRPGMWSDFVHDAEAIATDALAGLPLPSGDQLVAGGDPA